MQNPVKRSPNPPPPSSKMGITGEGSNVIFLVSTRTQFLDLKK